MITQDELRDYWRDIIRRIDERDTFTRDEINLAFLRASYWHT